MVAVFVLWGCTASRLSLDEYQGSQEEERVLAPLREYKIARNRKDREGILRQYAENARIIADRERNWYNKEGYAETLRHLEGTIQFSKPSKVMINGDKAEVHIKMFLSQHPQVTLKCKFKLVRDTNSNRWLIIERWYMWYSY